MDADFLKLAWSGEGSHTPQPTHSQLEASTLSVYLPLGSDLGSKGASVLSKFEGLPGLTLPESVGRDGLAFGQLGFASDHSSLGHSLSA